MRPGTRMLAWAAAVALATAAAGCGHESLSQRVREATVGGTVESLRGTAVTRGPVAVVLAGGPNERLHVIDLVGGRVMRTVKLRSFAQFCAADEAGRRVVTAQCGLVADDADSACGVIAVDGSAGARYIPTRVPNPTEVAVLGSTAYVVHGFEQREGLCLSAVDLERSIVTREAHVPAGTTAIASAGGRLFVADTMEASGSVPARLRLSVLDTATLVPRMLVAASLAGASVLDDPLSSQSRPTLLLLGARDASSAASRRGTAEVWRLDATSGEVLQRKPLEGLVAGAFGGCVTRGAIAVLDASDADGSGSDAGGIALYDTRTLEPRGRLEVTAPLAVASWGERVLVVSGVAGSRESAQLVVFEDGSLRPASRVPLPSVEVMADIAVLDAK